MKKGEEVLTVKEDKDQEHKVIEFKTRAQIAMGDEVPIDPDWLMGLNEGCIFLARKKDTIDESLFLFTILSKKERSIWLSLALPEDKSLERWVDSSRFSNNWELYEVLQEGYQT
jgi:hypothetical protein